MKSKSDILIILSIIAAILAAVVSFTQETIWIAGTQWILIAIVLGVYAVYYRMKTGA